MLARLKKALSKILIVGLYVVSVSAIAAPGLLELDYSFERPLIVESRVVDTIRFDIIKPESKYASVSEYTHMPEVFRENRLIMRCLRSNAVNAFASDGEFSFRVHDQRLEKGFRDQYMVIGEWGGGKVFRYLIFDTATAEEDVANCKTLATFKTTSDRYEVTDNGSLILYAPVDMDNLEGCPLSDHPFQKIEYIFSENGPIQKVLRKAVKPSCAG